MKTAALYARVSSDQQKEEKTIASQVAALVEFARAEGFAVPDEWIFQDEGYSGSNLVRPGLERVRDLAAAGEIEAVLVLSPDRLSRKYAYRVLLMEDLARHGVEIIFKNSPHSGSPEDQLLVQFQGMIAEYERAQILERSRRGKLHRARQGEVSVLSGAPYGYRYIRKTDEHAGFYEIIEAEADVVRQAYAWYTREGLSIGGGHAPIERTRGADAEVPRSMGTLHGVGHAAQPGLSRHRLLRQDKTRRTHAHQQSRATPTGEPALTQQRESRGAAGAVDRDRGTRLDRGADLCVSPRAFSHKQETLGPSND